MSLSLGTTARHMQQALFGLLSSYIGRRGSLIAIGITLALLVLFRKDTILDLLRRVVDMLVHVEVMLVLLRAEQVLLL